MSKTNMFTKELNKVFESFNDQNLEGLVNKEYFLKCIRGNLMKSFMPDAIKSYVENSSDDELWRLYQEYAEKRLKDK